MIILINGFNITGFFDDIRKYFLVHVKKYILKTKENVPYCTVPVETFWSGYSPLSHESFIHIHQCIFNSLYKEIMEARMDAAIRYFKDGFADLEIL